jgi:hypothetical protein
MKRFLFVVLLILSSILLFNSIDREDVIAEFDPLKIEIGEMFEYLNYEKEMYVLNYQIADIDDNGENDLVIVIGEKTEESDFYKNIDVIVYNQTNEMFTAAKLKNYEGKMPRIELDDVDGDKVRDVILIATCKNNDNSMSIVSFNEKGAKEIFKSKESKGLEISGQILDGFKARITIKNLKQEFEVDLSENKENYITNGFYLENGKLNTDKVKISSAGIYNIELIKIDDKVGVKYTERIKGFDNLDIIDQLKVLIKYDNGKWSIVEVISERFGKVV